MNSTPTYRRGRRIYIPGEKKQLFPCCNNYFIAILLYVIIPPLIFYKTEQYRFQVYSSLAEIIDMDTIELSSLRPPSTQKEQKEHQQNEEEQTRPATNSIVHGIPTYIQSSTSDPSMNIHIPHSLQLTRNTEYCQWEEIRGESCQTCTRTINENETETYDCNCIETFDYIKGWKNYRINSLFFDQPAKHHNPQRDPMPRKVFVSNDVRMEFGRHRHRHRRRQPHNSHSREDESLDQNQQPEQQSTPFVASLSPTMIERNGIRGCKSRTIKWVKGGIPPLPSTFWHKMTTWIPDNTRYEDSYHLYHHHQHQHHHHQ